MLGLSLVTTAGPRGAGNGLHPPPRALRAPYPPPRGGRRSSARAAGLSGLQPVPGQAASVPLHRALVHSSPVHLRVKRMAHHIRGQGRSYRDTQAGCRSESVWTCLPHNVLSSTQTCSVPTPTHTREVVPSPPQDCARGTLVPVLTPSLHCLRLPAAAPCPQDPERRPPLLTLHRCPQADVNVLSCLPSSLYSACPVRLLVSQPPCVRSPHGSSPRSALMSVQLVTPSTSWF